MLSVRIVCVGRLKEAYWRGAVAEYEKRLGSLCKFQILELPEARLSQNPTAGEIAGALDKEAELILPKLAGQALPLCVEGRAVSSEELAGLLDQAMQSPGAVSFVIGSSYDLADRVKQTGRGISLSAMTFPHQLARVMLCEQVYRALQILRGAPYHK